MKKKKQIKKKAPSNSIGISPLGDRVLIQEIETEGGGETKAGIIIPETIREDKGAKKGRVVAVGEGRREEGKLIQMSVKIGDTVLFQWGDQVKIGDKEYHVVSESNIIAIVK